MPDVRMPDGAVVRFPDEMPKEQIRNLIATKFPDAVPQQTAPQQQEPAYAGGTFRAATEGSHAGLMGGFDDEITAGMLAPVDAAIDWFKGDGFDMGKAYTRKQQMLDQQKQARRAEHPVASIGGEIAGGLALGGGASKAGLTLAGKSLPALGKTGAAALEGAGYGGLYGAGEAKPGERLSGAATGAAIGGVAGGALQGIGNAIATRSAQRVANVAAPTSDDLASASQALYRASEKEGVRYKAPAVQRLRDNLKLAAGRVNDRLRPKTAGFVDDVDAMFSGDLSLEAFDEFRKSLNKELRRASPDDARTLTSMKKMADSFADNVSTGEFTGDAAKATDFLKQARQTWARSAKTEAIEKILDVAEVDGAGKYTQAGFANAVKNEMKKLYKSTLKGGASGWTKEEISLIRQMAMGGSNSKVINLMAKFSPRGPMSIVLGQVLGSTMPGVGNVAVPLAGHVAGEMADRGAMQAAQALRTGAATGMAPRVAPQVTNKTVPFIGSGSAASTEIPRLLEARRAR